MERNKRSRDADSRPPHFKKIAIAAFALATTAAAGVAFQYREQPRIAAVSPALNKMQPVASPSSDSKLMPVAGKDHAPYDSSKTQPYCPVEQRREGAGPHNPFCTIIRSREFSLEAVKDLEVFHWTRNVIEGAVSKVAPTVQLIADHCLAYLK